MYLFSMPFKTLLPPLLFHFFPPATSPGTQIKKEKEKEKR